MARYRILSLDGGGIKGLLSATLLTRLLERRPTLIERTDLIAGTSTGGILALGLAVGLAPEALARLYRERADRIFDDSFWDDLIDLGKAVGADYSNRKLRRELKRHFGDRTLGDLDKRVLIPAFDLDAPATATRPRAWKPKFFHNFPGEDSDQAETVVDVALRTSAAPTYFPAHQGYVDGGVVANNPAMAAVAQALDPRAAGVALHEIALLSVGTGHEPKSIRARRVDWGWGQWARPLVSMMISGVAGVADFQCRQLIGPDRYQRLDPILDRGVDLDDHRPRTLDYLIQSANQTHLDPTVDFLQRNDW
jgi:patatin-like phospholipase/acyl hydrolase